MGGGGPPLHDGCGVVGVIHVSNCGPTLGSTFSQLGYELLHVW